LIFSSAANHYDSDRLGDSALKKLSENSWFVHISICTSSLLNTAINDIAWYSSEWQWIGKDTEDSNYGLI
jgi:hypothetical protein